MDTKDGRIGHLPNPFRGIQRD